MIRLHRRLILLSGISACALLLLARPHPAGAEHFNITIHAETDHAQVNSITDTTPPIGGVNPRPVLNAKVGEMVRINWHMASGFPHGTMKNVTVHFFVVHEDNIGQKPVPDPAGNAGIVDNSFVLDFAPSTTTQGAIRFKVTDPGNYLVRLQSENTHIEHDHEHFSAFDLKVE